MNTRLGNSQVVLVWAQPFLVRILERRRQGRHDLAAVAEIASYLCPFLLFANVLESTTSFDGLLEPIQVEWFLIDVWKAGKIRAALVVELGQSIKI